MTEQSASATLAVAVYVRLWMVAEPGSSNSLPAWNDGTPLVQMMREMVCFCGGVPCLQGDPSGLLLAHFADELQAIYVARQVQALVTGFAAVEVPQAVAASLAIVPPSLTEREDDVAELKDYLKQRAQPAQILFTSLGEDTSLPTGAYRKQSLGSSGRVQLSELVWRHKDRAATAAVQAHARATKHQQRIPVVSEPQRLPEVARPGLMELSQDLRTDIGRTLRDLSTKVHGWMGRVPFVTANSSKRSAVRSRNRWIGMVAVFAGVCAVFVLVHRRSPAPPVVVAPGGPASAANTSQRPAAVATPLSTVPLPPVSGFPGKATSNPEKHAVVGPDLLKRANVDERPERVAREHGGLSPEQTRQVISRGQAQLDRGCYVLAIGYFRRVLQDDSHNALANNGIEKARNRMQLDSTPKAACQ